jgi:hypothetical protein
VLITELDPVLNFMNKKQNWKAFWEFTDHRKIRSFKLFSSCLMYKLSYNIIIFTITTSIGAQELVKYRDFNFIHILMEK